MPVALPTNALSNMRGQADKVRQRLQGSGQFQDFSRFAELSGARAIVSPGKSIVVRLLPRWDVTKHYLVKDGKRVPNPNYPEDDKVMIYVPASAHWFQNPTTNKPHRLWCRLMLNVGDVQGERCPICEAETALRHGSDDDKKLAKDIRAKECYLFNAVIRGPKGETLCNDKGEVDIRILNTPPTVWVAIIDTMTGGPDSQAEFAKGQIFDVEKGFDLMITRPASGGNDRYKVACANTETPLYTNTEAAKWKGWTNRLYNLETEIGPENIPSFNDMWKAFYGRDPDDGEAVSEPAATEASMFNGGAEAEAESGIDPGQFETGGPEEPLAEEVPAEFDAIGLPGAEEPPAPTRPPAKAAPPKAQPPAAPRPTAPRPTAPARGRR